MGYVRCHGLLGMRLTRSGKVGQSSLHLTHRTCGAEAPWSRPQYKLTHPSPPAYTLQNPRASKRIVLQKDNYCCSLPSVAPLFPLPQKPPASPILLVMIHEQFFPVAVLHCRNCGRDSRITE